MQIRNRTGRTGAQPFPAGRKRLAGRLLVASGGLAAAAALGWWALVFGPLVVSATLTPADAARCLMASSDLCRLAALLCRRGHLLDIRFYSPGLLWTAALLLACALALALRRRRPAGGI